MDEETEEVLTQSCGNFQRRSNGSQSFWSTRNWMQPSKKGTEHQREKERERIKACVDYLQGNASSTAYKSEISLDFAIYSSSQFMYQSGK